MRTVKLGLTILMAGALLFSCKKDDKVEDDNSSTGGGSTSPSTDKVLIIEQGNSSLNPTQTINYSAIYVKVDGSQQAASNITWSTNDNSIAEINSAGVLTAKGIGTSTVTATVGGDKAEVLAKVTADYPFLVLPGVYAGYAGETIQLNPVYLGSQNPTYTYSSSDNNILSVNSTGQVSLVGAGSAVIDVTSSAFPNSPFPVSILVWPSVSISLPVVRVDVTPKSVDLFRGDNSTLTATAYDINNSTVSATFNWSSLDNGIATVNASGMVTAVSVGETKIKATAQGMIGFCDVLVSPDTVVIVTPFTASVAPGDTKQYSASAYNARTNTVISSITNFDWEIPTYGLPVFDIATVSSSGLVTMKSNAQLGLLAPVIASVPGNANALGAANVMVGQPLNCGAGNAAVDNITVSNGNNVTISLFGMPTTLNATGRDAANNTVAAAALKFNSDDTNVVNVDEDTGELFPFAPGTATITICSGNFASTTVIVTVQ